jgi:hypothetical protein
VLGYQLWTMLTHDLDDAAPFLARDDPESRPVLHLFDDFVSRDVHLYDLQRSFGHRPNFVDSNSEGDLEDEQAHVGASPGSPAEEEDTENTADGAR